MSLLSKQELVRMAVTQALSAGLDPALVCAHIDVRSRWHSGMCEPTAISYLVNQSFSDPREPEYRSICWGLMGIQGEFARAEGFEGSLTTLLTPAENLRLGCHLFSRLGRNSDPIARDVEVLRSWNREDRELLVRQTLLKIETYRELLQRMPSQQQTFLDDGTIPRPLHLQIRDNVLLEVGSSTHTRMKP